MVNVLHAIMLLLYVICINRLEGLVVEEDQSLASAHQHYPNMQETIELVRVAVDHRPGIPYLVSMHDTVPY